MKQFFLRIVIDALASFCPRMLDTIFVTQEDVQLTLTHCRCTVSAASGLSSVQDVSASSKCKCTVYILDCTVKHALVIRSVNSVHTDKAGERARICCSAAAFVPDVYPLGKDSTLQASIAVMQYGRMRPTGTSNYCLPPSTKP